MIGKTIQERVEALIEVAHPKFREELRQKAIEKNFMLEVEVENKEETMVTMES